MRSSKALGLVEALARRRIVLLALELRGFRFHFLDRGRTGCRADPHPCRGLVDQVDRLVGQEARRDVAIRELGGRDKGVVGEGDLVMRLQLVTQAAQDHDGLLDARFRHKDRLKAPLERRVLLDVLLVFIQCRCADQAELAARQRWLEHIGDVETALAPALPGPDDRVQLVHEQDQRVLLRGDLLDQLLRALLEFAAVLRSRNHRVDIHFDEPLVAQDLRHVAVDDPLCQSFHDGCLADARLTDQHGIVLLAPGKHLDRALDFLCAPQHRIELALARQGGEIAAKLVQVGRACAAFEAAVLRALPHHLDDLLAQAFRCHAILLEQGSRDALGHRGKTDQQMLGPDVRVAQFLRRLEGKLKGLLQTRRDRHPLERRVGGRFLCGHAHRCRS